MFIYTSYLSSMICVLDKLINEGDLLLAKANLDHKAGFA